MAKHSKKTGRANAATGGTNPATPNPKQIHSFSRTIAKEHGEKAAVLLQYLAHHVSKSKHIHGGKRWFYKTLDDLAVVFPYLKRSTIHATLQKLGRENGPLGCSLLRRTIMHQDVNNKEETASAHAQKT